MFRHIFIPTEKTTQFGTLVCEIKDIDWAFVNFWSYYENASVKIDAKKFGIYHLDPN